jgi:hypothetical protein
MIADWAEGFALCLRGRQVGGGGGDTGGSCLVYSLLKYHVLTSSIVV